MGKTFSWPAHRNVKEIKEMTQKMVCMIKVILKGRGRGRERSSFIDCLVQIQGPPLPYQ